MRQELAWQYVAALNLICTWRLAGTQLTLKLICYWHLAIGNLACIHLIFLQCKCWPVLTLRLAVYITKYRETRENLVTSFCITKNRHSRTPMYGSATDCLWGTNTKRLSQKRLCQTKLTRSPSSFLCLILDLPFPRKSASQEQVFCSLPLWQRMNTGHRDSAKTVDVLNVRQYLKRKQ